MNNKTKGVLLQSISSSLTSATPPGGKQAKSCHDVDVRTEAGTFLTDVLSENCLLQHAVEKSTRRLFVLRGQVAAAQKSEAEHINLLEVQNTHTQAPKSHNICSSFKYASINKAGVSHSSLPEDGTED